MGYRSKFLATSIFLLSCQAASAASPEAGRAIVLQGNGKVSTACVACHGAEGAGNAQAVFPQLARQNADYLAKQIHDFQRATRKDPVMQPIAKALSENEIADVSAYFAAQRPAAPVAADPALLARGARIALSGFWEKDVPACIS